MSDKSKDKDSIAKSKGKRSKKDVKSRETLASDKTDSAESVSSALRLKRKHVYDSLEQARAVRSRSHSNSKELDKPKSAKSVTKSSDSSAGAETAPEPVKSKSSSKSDSNKYHDTSLDGKPYNLKITTWNINGLRSWLSKRNGMTFMTQDKADVYCFQETKCANSKVPSEIKEFPGYNCYWNGNDNGMAGVACFAKTKPKNVVMGIGNNDYDKESRVITMEFDKYYVINAYVPNSGRELVRLDFRMKWDADFQEYIKKLDSQKPVIVCGDLNVSHQEIDLANPKTNLKTAGFTIGERNNFTKLLTNVDLLDVFRYLNPDKKDSYTFWTYMRQAREKNIGWRLDYFLVSKKWVKKICDCVIRSDVYGSDHCPVSLYMSI